MKTILSRPFVMKVRLPLALFLFLSACYLLFFTGAYYSIDEMAMFNMAESLLKGQGFSIDQLNWIELSPTSSVGSYGVDGRLYTKVAQTQSLAALPLVWLAGRSMALGQIQTAFLLNIVLTSLNAVLIFALGRRLGHRERHSLLAALLYGLATIAFPYAKTFFSEPLSGFCLLGACYLLAGYRQSGRLWRPLLAGMLLGLAAATRLVNAVFAPFFAFYLLLLLSTEIWQLPWHRWPAYLWRQGWRQWRPLAVLAAPGVLALGLIALHNSGRFAAATQAGYAQWDAFSADPLTAIYALLLSPGKSLFLYTPLYLLVVALFPRFFRRHRPEAVLIGSMTLAYLLILSRWSGFTGGWAWGPRLLVPLAPLWAVPLLMLGERLSASGGRYWRRWRGLAWPLIALSLGMQGLGLLVDYAEYLRSLPGNQRDLITVFDPVFSAHWGHWQLLSAGRVDLGWLLREELAPVSGVDWPALLPLLAALLLTGSGLVLAVRRGGHVLVAHGVLLLGLMVVPLTAVRTVAHYSAHHLLNKSDIEIVTGLLDEYGRSGDAIISTAVTHSQPFQNLYDGPLPLYGTRNEPLESYPPVVAQRLESFAAPYNRLWLLLEWTPPGVSNSGLELWLAQRGFLAGEWASGGLRLLLYDIGSPPEIQAQSWQLGDAITLTGYGLSTTTPSTAEMLRLTLVWQAERRVDENYTIFVQLLDANGQLAAQIDRQPWNSLRPTAGWEPGRPLEDHYAFELSGLAPGIYALTAGMYAWPSLEPLPVRDGAGMVVGEWVTLEKVVVGEVR